MSLQNTELKPYAEPVPASALSPKENYFMVTYLDVGMLVPEIKTLVFLGKDIDDTGNVRLNFQDIESYVALGAYTNRAQGMGELYTCAENQLKNIFELDKAIDELTRCALRRAKRPSGAYEFLGV